MLRAVDELIGDAMVSDATWQTLAAEFDDQQLMDLVFTVGAYEVAGHGLPLLRGGARRRPQAEMIFCFSEIDDIVSESRPDLEERHGALREAS